jgi:ATP-dependent Clp protease adaptor protein ClpS
MGKQVERVTSLSKERAKPKLQRPSRYQVVILNDDFTPMDFVVGVLKLFFSMQTEQAVATMLKVHYQGRAVCGVFTRDIAETKVAQVNDFARQHEYPLLCTFERV